MTKKDPDSIVSQSTQAAIADATRAFIKAAKDTPKMSYHELSDTEYTRRRDQVIIKSEGISETPYADGNGIASMGIGVNLRVKDNLRGVLDDLGLLPEEGGPASQPGKLTEKQIGELEAIAAKKYPATPQKLLEHNSVQRAFDAKMAEFHKEDPRIPAHLAYPSEAPLLAKVKSALSDFEQHDQAQGTAAPAVDSADAKALHIDALTPAQRDQLRDVINDGASTNYTMLNLNAKMAQFHGQNADIPESVPGSSVAKMKTMTDGLIAENFEPIVDKWIPGMPPSSERAAFVSMAYDNLIRPHNQKSLRRVVLDGNHAEAAAQIAFLENGGDKPEPGIATRRLDEADLVGTAPPNRVYGPATPSLTTDFQIVNAADLHADAIQRNLKRWGSGDTHQAGIYSERVDDTYVMPANYAYGNIFDREKALAAKGVHTDRDLRAELSTPAYNGDSQFEAVRFDMANCLGVKFTDAGQSDPAKLNSPATPVQPDGAAPGTDRSGR